MTDPYAILGVSPSISDEDLTGAYRKLAKKYHPDMNHGNKAAEKKMQEINAAYDQIKNERSGNIANDGPFAGGPFTGRGYGGAYGPGSFWGGGASGQGPGRSYDPFGWFGGFRWNDDADNNQGGEDASGRGGESWGGAGGRSASGNPRFLEINQLIRSGYYQQALRMLFAFDATERGAEWFFYSALANLGVGNRVTALRHAQEAVRLAPDVQEYRSLLNQLESGSFAYRQAGSTQGYGMRNIGRAVMQCLFSQLLCYCFCCRPC